MEKVPAVTMRILRLALLGLCGCVAAASAGRAQEPAGSLPARERMELQTLARQLADPERSQATKVDAASMLLTRGYPQAGEALRGFLADAANRPARIAVARAVADTGLGQPAFVDPLFAMLADAEPTVRAAASAALGTYRDRAVLDRLLALARNEQAEQAIRLAGISALGSVLDQASVEGLIVLLDSPQPNIRAAAAGALAKLTGIRSFGADAVRWRAWWTDNKDKDRQQWLEELLDSLARQNALMEAEATGLRGRLASTLLSLYSATPPADRPALLLNLLKDPLSDVQLVGIELTGRRLTGGEAVPAEANALVPVLLAGENDRVRAAAARLMPTLNDPQATATLLARLADERTPGVREALVAALGALRAREAVGPLLDAVANETDPVAAAAAVAVGRIAEKAPLDEGDAQRAVEVLTDRYARAAEAAPPLREALIGAMGALGRTEPTAVMRSALADPAAAVRLAAVRGLETLKDPALAADIAPLVADGDRGVRQAAITALGTLGALDLLDTILARTLPEVESDPPVRQRAWDTVLALLAKAPPQRLDAVLAALDNRVDARDYRIRLLSMKIARFPDDPALQADVRLLLAAALCEADRPAEAAAELDLAYRALPAGSERAAEAWLRWMDALLAADDASVLGRMVAQQDADRFAAAVDLLVGRLGTLRAVGRFDAVIALADQANVQLKDRLPADRLAAVKAALDEARAQQARADQEQVAQLLPRLTDADPAKRTAASDALLAMRARAVAPLIEQLRAVVSAEQPNPALESAILDLLPRLAPDLTGYNPQTAPADRLKVIEGWLKKLTA